MIIGWALETAGRFSLGLVYSQTEQFTCFIILQCTRRLCAILLHSCSHTATWFSRASDWSTFRMYWPSFPTLGKQAFWKIACPKSSVCDRIGLISLILFIESAVWKLESWFCFLFKFIENYSLICRICLKFRKVSLTVELNKIQSFHNFTVKYNNLRIF